MRLDRNNLYNALPQIEKAIADIKESVVELETRIAEKVNDILKKFDFSKTDIVANSYRFDGHTSGIGEWQKIDFSNTTYSKTGTPQVVGTFYLDTGVWLALARVTFANKSNATYRAIAITSNSGGWTNGYVQTPATNGAGTGLQFSYVCCPVADNSPYYIRVNAGADSIALSNISVTFVRIK